MPGSILSGAIFFLGIVAGLMITEAEGFDYYTPTAKRHGG
jgi:hypothetical protein